MLEFLSQSRTVACDGLIERMALGSSLASILENDPAMSKAEVGVLAGVTAHAGEVKSAQARRLFGPSRIR